MLWLILVLSACVATGSAPLVEQQQQTQVEPKSKPENGWYAVRFSIFWEKGQEPQWYIGALIAGEIISPLLQQSQQNIACWRIHRRAVRDKAGHVLSFIFYSSQADAAMIYQGFKDHKLLTELRTQHQIDRVEYDALYRNVQTKIADTSDPDWPENMRSTWPFFMMGVSHMWLEQIRAFKKETPNESDMQPRYITIQSKLTELWQQQGQHALLHHLNALYAYEPLFTHF